MEKDSDEHQLVGGQNAKSAIPWQVLITGTIYILVLSYTANIFNLIFTFFKNVSQFPL